jgi:uncharacterized protein (TIGR02270 family)
MMQQRLEGGQGGEAFAATVLAIESPAEDRLSVIIELGTASEERIRGIISALAWLPWELSVKIIDLLVIADDPTVRRIGIAAAALHRKSPGGALSKAFGDADAHLKARAFRAAGELGQVDFVSTLRQNLKDQDEACQFWAAWSATLLTGDTKALDILKGIVEGNGPHADRAMNLAIRRMERSAAMRWLEELATKPVQKRLAIQAAGALGLPDAVAWLLQQMEVPSLARVAFEAFSLITGADSDRDNLQGEKPEGFESGPTENPADEDVAMDPDEHLAWPNLPLVTAWWQRHHERFPYGIRHLLGHPIELNNLTTVLRSGRQRQRAAASLELAIQQPGTPLFEVRAPGFRQIQVLGKV